MSLFCKVTTAWMFCGTLMLTGVVDANDAAKFVGTWKIVRYQDDGKDRLSRLGAGPAKKDGKARVAYLVFTADECYIIRGDGRREMASGLANAGFRKFTLASGTEPQSIDLDGFAGRNNEKTKTYPGIYRIEGSRLVICYCEQGARRPTEFQSDGANNLLEAERISKEPLPIPNKQAP